MLRPIIERWLVFAAALGVSLLPGAAAVLILPRLEALPRSLEWAWVWSIMAIPRAGFTRTAAGGAVWLEDSGWLLALGFWAAAGFGVALACRRVPLKLFAILALPLVVGIGLAALYGLSLIGISGFVYV